MSERFEVIIEVEANCRLAWAPDLPNDTHEVEIPDTAVLEAVREAIHNQLVDEDATAVPVAKFSGRPEEDDYYARAKRAVALVCDNDPRWNGVIYGQLPRLGMVRVELRQVAQEVHRACARGEMVAIGKERK